LIDDFPTTIALLFLRVTLPLLKRAVGVRRLTAWLSVKPAAVGAGDSRAEQIRRANETLVRAGRLLIADNCLDRSLAAFWMLRRAGASPRLVLGAKSQGGAVAGHAWIEVGNASLEPRAAEFVRIATFGGD
jgi:hypothetical protein